MAMISHPHIRLDAQGVAWIDDTNVKVIEVVLDRLAYGRSPEEIHFSTRSLPGPDPRGPDLLRRPPELHLTFDAVAVAYRRAMRAHGFG